MPKKYPRDLVGYGSKSKKINWPNNARIAVQIVLNYEDDGIAMDDENRVGETNIFKRVKL